MLTQKGIVRFNESRFKSRKVKRRATSSENRKFFAFIKIAKKINKTAFLQKKEMHVMKSTKPMERLSIDFKDLTGTLNRNNYMLTEKESTLGFHSHFLALILMPRLSLHL